MQHIIFLSFKLRKMKVLSQNNINLGRFYKKRILNKIRVVNLEFNYSWNSFNQKETDVCRKKIRYFLFFFQFLLTRKKKQVPAGGPTLELMIRRCVLYP